MKLPYSSPTLASRIIILGYWNSRRSFSRCLDEQLSSWIHMEGQPET